MSFSAPPASLWFCIGVMQSLLQFSLAKGIADNARDCNRASSCLHASSRLQELKELRLQKPWHRPWEMYIEIHVLPLTCWATLSKQSRTTAPGGTGHPYPIRFSGRQVFPTLEASYCSRCMEAEQTPLKEERWEVKGVADVGQWVGAYFSMWNDWWAWCRGAKATPRAHHHLLSHGLKMHLFICMTAFFFFFFPSVIMKIKGDSEPFCSSRCRGFWWQLLHAFHIRG